jgi:hypothetical protein
LEFDAFSGGVGVGVGKQERNSKQPNYGINNSRAATTIEN